jgi:site-specific recombinase XerD
LALFLRHLRQTGVIPQLLPPTDSPLDLIERDYARFLSCERGVAQVTIDYYVAIARRFLSERFGATTIMIEKLGAQDAGKFILRNTSTQCIGRLNLIASVLRSFLGFLYQRGKIAKNLAAAVPAVANRQARGHQEVLDPDQTKALLNVCNQATAVGRRDYAILLLLSRLGLRACEIVRLRLDDINWESGELLIRGKGAREDRLPLLQDVGQALVNYLQKGRPTCSSRQVFIRAIAPRQAFFTSSAVAGIVKQALAGAHLHLKHQGAHILRHSLATNMLSHGASLTEIGQILRHQKASTTQVYAKVDLVSLRALALPWPGGVR